jgi:hypothetical protein
MEIESLMKIDQENGTQTRNYGAGVTRAIDRDPIDHNLIDHDFDLLRARAQDRSIWAVRTQRMQEIVVTIMAIVLGSIMGWAVMR